MKPLYVTCRATGRREEERIFGKKAIALLYGGSWWGKKLAHLSAKIPFVSAAYGWLQKRPKSRKKIIPFIHLFGLDPSEFLEPIEHFGSFNDFFIRKLKPSARPIAEGEKLAICPADGRYRFIPNLTQAEGFVIKGEKFNLAKLLGDPLLAAEYQNGTLVMARLCPSDYHRFHFPVTCLPSSATFINGWLYSVHPAAIAQDIHIFTKNKRALTLLQTDHFDKVLFVEVGATNVGSIHQTFTPDRLTLKGTEKGYFEFGASALLIIFKKDTLQLDAQLLDLQQGGLEIKCNMGQPLGRGLL